MRVLGILVLLRPSFLSPPSLPLSPRCEWHEERENKHCCLGVVNMYCYVLSDTLCPKYNIALTANHLPPQTASQPMGESYTPSHRSTRMTSHSASTISSPPPTPSPAHLTPAAPPTSMSKLTIVYCATIS